MGFFSQNTHGIQRTNRRISPTENGTIYKTEDTTNWSLLVHQIIGPLNLWYHPHIPMRDNFSFWYQSYHFMSHKLDPKMTVFQTSSAVPLRINNPFTSIWGSLKVGIQKTMVQPCVMKTKNIIQFDRNGWMILRLLSSINPGGQWSQVPAAMGRSNAPILKGAGFSSGCASGPWTRHGRLRKARTSADGTKM